LPGFYSAAVYELINENDVGGMTDYIILKPTLSANFFTTNQTRIGLGLKSDLRGKRSTINHLMHGTNDLIKEH